MADRVARVRAAGDERSALDEADQRILGEIRDHSEIMENLEHLSDSIGPRLTGSPQLKQANDWTAEMFKKYGLSNVHLEPYSIAHSWTRGTAHARIVSPTEHPLTIASAGWSPSTPGTIRGPVVFVEAEKKEDFEKYRGKLKGAIVITQQPTSLSPPKPENPYEELLAPMQAPPPAKGQPAEPAPFARFAELARARNDFFKSEGVAAVLRDSGKPHGLLNMTGVGGRKFDIGPIPNAFVTGEGYRMIFRMLKHGPVDVEIEMTNKFSDGPVQVFNTVGELRGGEKAEEVVMLGAHLDSWDLGTGSTDNGTGSMIVLEAARALAKLALKPKRTIRFALFSGEEQGLVGSEEYVKAHRADLDKVSGILVHDTGTGRVLALGLHDNYQARQIVDQLLSPLRELKLVEPTMRRSFGTDHASFDEVGVPGFYVVQESAEYAKTHHSQSDTFDKVWKDDLIEGAQVLAAWAYNTAELPEKLPRRALPPRAAEGVPAEPPRKDPVVEADDKILAAAKEGAQELKTNLTYLTDQIGPRLTGSSELNHASHWALEQFTKLGLANAHLEPWTIANSWSRGPATGRIVSPAAHPLTLATAGWSTATPGTIRARVVGVEADTVADLEKYRGKLKGAVVVVGRPGELVEPKSPLLTPWGQPTIPLDLPKQNGPFNPESQRELRQARSKFFADEGAAAVLNGSEKWWGLLNMTTSGREYKANGVPTAFMTRENSAQIWRLLDAGPVEAELTIASTLGGKEAEVYNTVAEIRGSEKPDEVVIIGGHLDSWDLGTGATDDGTGSMAVIAAARALVRSGVKPKRTIRFVLFTGEEQGLNGSRAYVKAHAVELGKISAVLVHDSGTGRVLTVGLMGNYNAKETMDRVLYPLARGVGLAEPTLDSEGGSDHVPFGEAGVPGFWCVQEPANYDKMHHSQADTLDHVRWEDLLEGSAVLAVFAYNVSEWPELVPRKAQAAPSSP
jgi:Zn-dependent M28 family amino/carboxypeptidase